jgi:signal transduction histidine kinase/AmiR/NasT family two-component response regulator
MTQKRILVVEDERIIADDIRRSLLKMGYGVTSIVNSGEKAIIEAAEQKPDLVLMDIILKGKMDGIEAAEQIRSRFNTPVVFLTAFADDKILERAKATGPFGYIVKPFKERDMHINIEIALYKFGMEKELKESKEWFYTTLKSIGEAVIATDPNGNIIFMNRVSQLLTGWDMKDAVGKPICEIYTIINEVDQTVLIDKYGIKVSIEDRCDQIKDYNGDVLGSVIVFRDITQLKQAEMFRIEKERLESANIAKSEFLTNMSHELRTPLNSVIGFAQLVGEGYAGELNETQKRYIDNISIAGNFLLNLINDILDLCKVEAGKIELNIENISLWITVEEAITLIKEQALKHNIIINKEFDPEIDLIDADEQRVKQILFNILSNAIKFSKEEGGTITITGIKADENVQISVCDTGIGIKPESIRKVFRKFEQLDKGISQKYEGTGLGLAITKHLVELHGGRIWVKSKYGEGSTFTFTLPLR